LVPQDQSARQNRCYPQDQLRPPSQRFQRFPLRPFRQWLLLGLWLPRCLQLPLGLWLPRCPLRPLGLKVQLPRQNHYRPQDQWVPWLLLSLEVQFRQQKRCQEYLLCCPCLYEGRNYNKVLKERRGEL
jgi:hypothetical protein